MRAALDRSVHGIRQLDLRPRKLVLAGTAEDEKLVDYRDSRSISPVAASSSVATPWSPPDGQGLEPQPQAGQGVPAVDRGRASATKSCCDADQPLDPLGHLVEGAGRRALLGGSFNQDGNVEVAADVVRRRWKDVGIGQGNLLGDRGGGDQGQQQHHPRQRRQIKIEG